MCVCAEVKRKHLIVISSLCYVNFCSRYYFVDTFIHIELYLYIYVARL